MDICACLDRCEALMQTAQADPAAATTCAAEAVELLRETMRRNPPHPLVLLEWARLLWWADHEAVCPRESIQACELALLLPGLDASLRGELHLELALVHASEDRLAEAEEHARAAIACDPHEVAAHVALARVLAQLGRSAEALAGLEPDRCPCAAAPELSELRSELRGG